MENESLTDVALKYARRTVDGGLIHFFLHAHDQSLCGISGHLLHQMTAQELNALDPCHACFTTKLPKEPDFDQEDVAYEDKVVDEHEWS